MIKVGDHVHIKPDWQIRECLYNKNATVVFMDYEDERATIQFTDEALKDEALAGFAKVSAPLIHPDCIRIGVGKLAPGWGYEGFKHNFIIVDEMSFPFETKYLGKPVGEMDREMYLVKVLNDNSDALRYAVAANMCRNSIYGKDANMCNNLFSQIKNISFTNRKKDGACVTTIIWKDGTRTMATSDLHNFPDYETGICICIAKKAVGDTLEMKGKQTNHMKAIYRKYIPGYKEIEKEAKTKAYIDTDKYNEGLAFTDCPPAGYDVPFQKAMEETEKAHTTVQEKFKDWVARLGQYRRDQAKEHKPPEFSLGSIVKINEDYHYTIIAGKKGVVKEIKNISGDFEYLVSVNGFYINFWIGEEDLSPVYMEPNEAEGGTV